ncbi:MAG: extracellular solute-binding protein [Lachnospirales bacterium]
MKRKIMGITALALAVTTLYGCSSNTTVQEDASGDTATEDTTEGSEGSEDTAEAGTDYSNENIEISLTYPDNPTLPFREDWLSVTTVQEELNVTTSFEVIPIADYGQKISLMLNSQDAPDVILYQSPTTGELASLALNGQIVAISDYPELTPNFNKMVEEFGLQDAVDETQLIDGKRYYMPRLFDQPFYDGGLILRDDLLEEYGLEAPTTYDELYEVLKVFKEHNPDSYPLTTLVEPRVLYRMTMPSFGISLGANGASGTKTLSWDYENEEYFAGAISDNYKEYLTYFNKLYSEGLLDPEMANAGDNWTIKMATGKSLASYAYYDQIGGVVENSQIEGISLNLYPPLEGPSGAYHQEKSSIGAGIYFPITTAERDDFEELVRRVDEMFFSPEMAELWCVGVEGETFERDGDSYKYSDALVDSPDGIYKTLQVQYGLGADPLQYIWVNSREMTKYDENYAEINATVASMDNAIQPIPPSPKLDEDLSEEVGFISPPLADAFDVWAIDFISGKKSIEADWDTYVQEMKDKKIERYVEIYNENLK